MSPNVYPSTIFLGLDVHKESITIAVLPSDASAPTRADKLSYDLRKLRRYLERLGPTATIRASVTPCDQQPGRPGTDTLDPSSVRSSAILYLKLVSSYFEHSEVRLPR